MTAAEFRFDAGLRQRSFAADPSAELGVERTAIDGKFLSEAGRRFYVRGVRYGAFRPDEAGHEYTDLDRIECDLRRWQPSA